MDILKVLVIIAFVIATICTIKLHPSIHQPMVIEDANFELTRISDTLLTDSPTPAPTYNNENTQLEQTTITNPKQVAQQTVDIVPQQTNVTTQTIQPQTQTRYVQPQNTEPQRQRIKTIPPKQASKPNTANEEEISDLEMLSQILKGVQEQTKPQSQKPKQNSNFKNPYMTEQEEIIAWNKWRSNLQNKIMEDSNAGYAPYGTIFLFTFIVDKYGNISNVKVQCSNPNYMDIARNGVKPAITNLQNKPILNFPKGTQRTSTVVTGSFILGSQNVYSNPNDYADYERVRH